MGERFGAATAISLIHSFGGSADDKSQDDYGLFAEAMGCAPTLDSVVAVGRPSRLPLLIGWVTDKPATAEQVARAL